MALVLLAPLARLAGCGSGGPLRVDAAASLTSVFQQLNPEATFEFAGSDQLAFQLEQGAKADVYASASPKYSDKLHAEKLVEEPRVFATNSLVLIVPSGNPGHVTGLGSLIGSSLRLVLGAKGVPVGDYTRKVLDSYCHSLDVVGKCPRARVVSEEQDVKGVVAKVALGEADAGFAYTTDVRAAGGKVRAIDIDPACSHREIRNRGRPGREAPCRSRAFRGARDRAARPRGAPGSRLRAAVRRSFDFALAVAAGIALAFLLLPLLALFLRVPPGGSRRRSGARRPRRAGRQPRDERGRAPAHPRARDACGIPPRDAGGSAAARSWERSTSRSCSRPRSRASPCSRPSGARGLLGGTLSAFGVSMPFTKTAVVLAVVFVASPFYLRQAIAAFAAVDPNLLAAARTLGPGPLRSSAGRPAARRPGSRRSARRSHSPAGSASSARRSCSRAASRA